MIWVVIGAFIFGACLGTVLMGAFFGNEQRHDPYEDRWWEDND